MKDKPVFIAGVGPRTGSTLIQRLINTLPDAMIWGEWSAEYIFVRLYEAVKQAQADFAERDAGLYKSSEIYNKWTASMIPPDIDNAFTAFLRAFKTKPIWGFKTVHNLTYIPIVKHLIPNARFIVIYRNPLDQVRSCMTAIWPELTAKEIVEKLLPVYQQTNKINNALWVDYNNLNITTIFDYIEEQINEKTIEALNTKIRGPTPLPANQTPDITALMPYYTRLKGLHQNTQSGIVPQKNRQINLYQ